MKSKKTLLLTSLSLGIIPIATIAAGCTSKVQENSQTSSTRNSDSKIKTLEDKLKSLEKTADELKNKQVQTENS
ncbi:hypothetical protein, partial [Mycoplasmopsis cricetuli]|uniref:hypothetical protein n=1 Tax=Mycoplasmopsis cricetuli TaxID=171283 RepID=UPI00056A23DF